MKKLFPLFLSALLVFSLVACGKPASSAAPPPIPVPSSASEPSPSSAPISSTPAPSSSSLPESQPKPQKAGADSTIEGTWVTGTVGFEGLAFTPAELEETLSQAAALVDGMEQQQAALELIKTLSMTFDADGKGTLTCTVNGKESNMPFTWEGTAGSYTLDDGTNPPTSLVHYEDNTLSYTYGGFELLLTPA